MVLIALDLRLPPDFSLDETPHCDDRLNRRYAGHRNTAISRLSFHEGRDLCLGRAGGVLLDFAGSGKRRRASENSRHYSSRSVIHARRIGSPA